jgi:hypothetical protein
MLGRLESALTLHPRRAPHLVAMNVSVTWCGVWRRVAAFTSIRLSVASTTCSAVSLRGTAIDFPAFFQDSIVTAR